MEQVKAEKAEFNKALGAEIRRLREVKKITTNALGRAIGVSWQTMDAYEQGERSISSFRLEQIRQALGVEQIELR